MANRFVYAIKEQNPDAELVIYSDTEGSSKQLNFLKTFWPHLYQNSHVIPNRVAKDYKVKSQFGEEIYPASLNNLPQEYLNIFKNSFKFYDLCLDALDWLNSDFDWFRYFYYFPKPMIEAANFAHLSYPDHFILCNLYSRPNSPYLLEKWYLESLIQKLTEKYNIVIPTTPENLSFYDFCKDNINVKVIVTTLEETFYLASKCAAFLGIDSGIRVMPYYFGKPTFMFTPYCKAYGQVLPSHLIRWVIYDKFALPMHFDLNSVLSLLENSLNHEACKLFPYYNHSEIDNIIIKRKYAC